MSPWLVGLLRGRAFLILALVPLISFGWVLSHTSGVRGDEQELRASAARIAEAAAESARSAHPGLDVGIRVEDCPAESTLVDASSEAGLVVVGTRGRGAFEGMVLGSVSHAVIYGARCAVAVVDEGEA